MEAPLFEDEWRIAERVVTSLDDYVPLGELHQLMAENGVCLRRLPNGRLRTGQHWHEEGEDYW